MRKVTIYRYEQLDRFKKGFNKAPGWGTLAFIEASNGVPVIASARKVDAALVNSQGRYTGPPLD